MQDLSQGIFFWFDYVLFVVYRGFVMCPRAREKRVTVFAVNSTWAEFGLEHIRLNAPGHAG